MIRPSLTEPLKLKELRKKGLMLLSAFFAAASQNVTVDTEESPEQMRDPCETAIYSVINMEFYGPDEELVRIDQKVEDQNQQELAAGAYSSYGEHPGYLWGDPELDEYYVHAAEVYKPYLTDTAIENYVQTEWPNALRLHRANIDYEIFPKHLTLDKAQIDGNAAGISAYEFFVYLEYVTAPDPPKHFDFIGVAVCTPEGKITHLSIYDTDQLYEQLDEDAKN
ncbi:hypothetical protein [Planococcus citreus]|uniref:Uncharacterized protein n=1 Tax=Planococcus citreus TaxID=1373 RepID=A0A497YJ75_9BACL|nr:hypothetical protein [Planococcus citreus]RLJ90639.1 hypothetical protein DFR62_0784 [Planococcus citreus]